MFILILMSTYIYLQMTTFVGINIKQFNVKKKVLFLNAT